MTLASDTIITSLNEQKQHLDELLSLLRQELAALANRDISQLEQISSAKSALLEQLQHTDSVLAQAPELESCKQQDWFKLQVASVDEQLELCKRQNDVNQLTLEQSQLTLARFKTELLASRGKSGLTYTNKGKPTVDAKGKSIKA